jgi:hypothetical protein
LFNNKQLSDNEFSWMKMLLKGFNKQRRAWLVMSVLLALFCGPVSAQPPLITNYSSFPWASVRTPLAPDTSGTNFQVITNFQTNTTISLTTSGSQIFINHNVLIDGTTNGVVFDANGLTRVFTVATNCQLILNNLTVMNGISTNGGAIYNSGTLIISNCILSGNSATNLSGGAGSSSSTGNGSSGAAGGSAEGGAIYSRGPVSIYYSVVGTNTALAGSGGSGGSGGNSLLFGGNGGDAGSGGSALGAAVFSTGSNNVFFASQFFNNTCTAGAAGSGGSGGSGAFGAYGGAGAPGGSAAGGGVYVAGPVYVTNCLFAQNTITAGPSGTDGSGNNNGFNGGEAVGGGVYISGAVTNAYFENSIFFNNTCTSGAGGSATGGSEDGGNGGSALGGGLTSAALLTTVVNCTLATNTLVVGAGGTGTLANGSTGGTAGWDIYRAAGVLKLSGSILSGGTNVAPNPMPNASGVTDEGYNISSDASLVQAFGDTTLINSTNTDLDSGLANIAGPPIGPADLLNPPLFLTLDIVDGSVATNYIPGVPGLTFPATDGVGNDRGSPTSAGAYELNPITIDTNAPPPTISTEPQNQQTNKGGSVTFTVSAIDNDTNNNLGYQWQLNGTNLSDNSTFSGSATSNLTVKNVTAADEGSYQVIVSVSLLENATTSSPPALLFIIDPAQITTQPVSKRDVPDGSVVTFSVAATGTPPFSYQWYWVTTGLATNMLADTNEISGSTNSTLTINPATAGDEGSYFVVVANQYGSYPSEKASLSIAADATPTVAISSPAADTRTNNLVVKGTATDNAPVTTVYYWVTNFNAGNSPARTTNYGTATLSTNGTTTKTWSITNVFLPGTNYVTVQSVDYSGKKSALATREFFYKTPAQFSLVLIGPGTNTASAAIADDVRPANGAMLNIGEGYALKAVPDKNYVLSNWTSSTGLFSNSLTLHFIMETNLTITGNFSTNLFLGAEGTYNGLFYQSNVTEQTAGMLKNLKIGPTGTYSGSLLLDGGTYSLSSSFNTSCYASNYVSRSKTQGGPLAVEMTLDWASGEITGSVSNLDTGGGWFSPLEAEKADASSPPSSAQYTVLLIPGTNAVGEIPRGFGYMLITNHNGTVTLSGALADGTAFNQTPPLGVLGDVPVYASLYGNTGLVLGWLGLSNGTVQAETSMAWIKPAVRSGTYYKEGFTNNLLVTGSGWTNPPAKVSAVSLLDGSLTITNTSLDLDFTVSITNNTVVKVSNATTNATNSLTGTIAPKTGLLTITFGNGAGKATTIGYGAILQDSTNGAGYFVTKTNAGAILFSP